MYSDVFGTCLDFTNYSFTRHSTYALFEKGKKMEYRALQTFM